MNLSFLRGLALTFVLLVACSRPVSGATVTWTNTAGGSWTDAANWTPNQAPGAADQAVITNAGTYVVTIPASVTIGGLTVGGSPGTQAVQQTGGSWILNGTTLVRAGGALTWIAGDANGRVTIDAGARLTLSGTASKNLYAATTNRGTIQLTAGDLYLYGNSGARLENEGVFDLQGDRDIYGIN